MHALILRRARSREPVLEGLALCVLGRADLCSCTAISGDLKRDFGEYWAMPGTVALMDAGSAIVVAYPRGSGAQSNLDLLRGTRAPFAASKPAAAVAYRVACD